jgi:hypothetical protein
MIMVTFAPTRVAIRKSTRCSRSLERRRSCIGNLFFVFQDFSDSINVPLQRNMEQEIAFAIIYLILYIIYPVIINRMQTS